MNIYIYQDLWEQLVAICEYKRKEKETKHYYSLNKNVIRWKSTGYLANKKTLETVQYHVAKAAFKQTAIHATLRVVIIYDYIYRAGFSSVGPPPQRKLHHSTLLEFRSRMNKIWKPKRVYVILYL